MDWGQNQKVMKIYKKEFAVGWYKDMVLYSEWVGLYLDLWARQGSMAENFVEYLLQHSIDARDVAIQMVLHFQIVVIRGSLDTPMVWCDSKSWGCLEYEEFWNSLLILAYIWRGNKENPDRRKECEVGRERKFIGGNMLGWVSMGVQEIKRSIRDECIQEIVEFITFFDHRFQDAISSFV